MRPAGISSSQWLRFNFYFLLEHFLGYASFQKIAGTGRSKLYKEIDQQLHNSGRGELLPFTEISGDISQEQLREKVLSEVNVPVVFRGAAKNWECVKKWDFDFFKTHYGDKEISLTDNVGLLDRNKPQQFEVMKFGDYIDELKLGALKYLKFSRIMDDDSTLKNDFDLAWLRRFQLPSSFGEQFLMFMGNKESMTPIHSGFANTVFVQITGRKKWIMWAPNERIFFDPRAERRGYNFTHADPYVMDDPRYPLLKYAKRYEVILEPGDVLWFPSQLWHQVENIVGGVSVAYKFVHLPTHFKASRLLTILFFLATKPNVFVDVFYHKAKKRDYIFTHKQAEVG